MEEVKRGRKKAIKSESGKIFYYNNIAEKNTAIRRARAADVLKPKKKSRNKKEN